MTQFRWGVLGTGQVARKFVLGLRATAAMDAVLVASRSKERARSFARELEIPTVADDYASAASHTNVDAWYIATPPALHLEHALLCLQAGRPTLIEKPLAGTAEDARQIAATATAAGVFCMEAMWTRFLPLVRELKSMVDRGQIGQPRFASGSFGINTDLTAKPSVARPELDGGALLHRGIYPLSLASHLLGPIDRATGQTRSGPTGVDEDAIVSAHHRGGALSASISSLVADTTNDLVVAGSDASIHVAAPIYRPSVLTITTGTPRGGGAPSGGRTERLKEGALLQGAKQRFDALPVDLSRLISRNRRRVVRRYTGNGYHYEAEEVLRCVRGGRSESEIMPLAESIDLIDTIESLRASWS